MIKLVNNDDMKNNTDKCTSYLLESVTDEGERNYR